MRYRKWNAYLTIEASYILPLAMGSFLFCVGMLLYFSDRCILYQNMLRRGVVAQMAMDEDVDHTIGLMPVFNVEEQKANWSKEKDKVIVEMSGSEHDNYSGNGLLGVNGRLGTGKRVELPVYNPEKLLWERRRLKYLVEKGVDLVGDKE